jgi:hypothetical protein
MRFLRIQPSAHVHMYPKSAHLPWNPILRFVLLGPITGALVGYAQVTVAVMIWKLHGTPDFYFRGGQGVVLAYLAFTIGGGMVGVAYGGLLSLFERYNRRRIQPLISLGLVLIAASISAAIIVGAEFQQRKIEWIFAPQFSALVLGLLASLASSVHCNNEDEQIGKVGDVTPD